MAIDAAWAAQLEAWVAEAPADAPLFDAAPAVAFTPTVVSPFRAAHLPEYRRRLLGVAAACAGWSRAAVVPLWAWVDWASECFERGDRDRWRAALAELERYTGVAP
jgi:hypothetical protein